jgi:hypothetical protein
LTTCENCTKFEEKVTVSKFGLWGGYCSLLKIGRRFDCDICDKFSPNNKIEKAIIHRAEIKLERLDEHFE